MRIELFGIVFFDSATDADSDNEETRRMIEAFSRRDIADEIRGRVGRKRRAQKDKRCRVCVSEYDGVEGIDAEESYFEVSTGRGRYRAIEVCLTCAQRLGVKEDVGT